MKYFRQDFEKKENLKQSKCHTVYINSDVILNETLFQPVFQFFIC